MSAAWVLIAPLLLWAAAASDVAHTREAKARDGLSSVIEEKNAKIESLQQQLADQLAGTANLQEQNANLEKELAHKTSTANDMLRTRKKMVVLPGGEVVARPASAHQAKAHRDQQDEAAYYRCSDNDGRRFGSDKRATDYNEACEGQPNVEACKAACTLSPDCKYISWLWNQNCPAENPYKCYMYKTTGSSNQGFGMKYNCGSNNAGNGACPGEFYYNSRIWDANPSGYATEYEYLTEAMTAWCKAYTPPTTTTTTVPTTTTTTTTLNALVALSIATLESWAVAGADATYTQAGGGAAGACKMAGTGGTWPQRCTCSGGVGMAQGSADEAIMYDLGIKWCSATSWCKAYTKMSNAVGIHFYVASSSTPGDFESRTSGLAKCAEIRGAVNGVFNAWNGGVDVGAEDHSIINDLPEPRRVGSGARMNVCSFYQQGNTGANNDLLSSDFALYTGQNTNYAGCWVKD